VKKKKKKIVKKTNEKINREKSTFEGFDILENTIISEEFRAGEIA